MFLPFGCHVQKKIYSDWTCSETTNLLEIGQCFQTFLEFSEHSLIQLDKTFHMLRNNVTFNLKILINLIFFRGALEVPGSIS